MPFVRDAHHAHKYMTFTKTTDLLGGVCRQKTRLGNQGAQVNDLSNDHVNSRRKFHGALHAQPLRPSTLHVPDPYFAGLVHTVISTKL